MRTNMMKNMKKDTNITGKGRANFFISLIHPTSISWGWEKSGCGGMKRGHNFYQKKYPI
jgi:hypothetical protein